MAEDVESKPPGQIITFYSYKGGTGRSMAMANVAYVLSQNSRYQRKKVLMIDWDLEAPGLYRYFEHDLTGKSNSLASADGLLEFVELADRVYRERFSSRGLPENRADSSEAEKAFEEVRRTFELDKKLIEVLPNLKLLKAGNENEQYANRVRSFQWEEFHDSYSSFFTHFRRYLSTEFDFVLIDSRTGLTDTGGICTRVMPEKLVGVFAPNYQNIEGLKKVIQGAYDHRRQSRDPRSLVVYPLASRIDSVASKLRKAWWKGGIVAGQTVDGYERIFEELFIEMFDLDECDLHSYFDSTQIPHDSDYAYGEEIAARYESGVADKLSIGTACANLTQYLVELDAPWESFEDDAELVAAQREVSEAKTELVAAREKYRRIGITVVSILIIISALSIALYLQFRNERLLAQAERSYAAGLQAMSAGNEEAAIQSFSEAIATRPNFADAYKNRGDAYSQINQYSEAIADYTQAIQLAPSSGSSTSTDSYLGRATAYVATKQYDLAISDYTKVIQSEPTNWTAYMYRGATYHRQKNYVNAIADFTTVIDSKDPALDADAYYERGISYRELGDQERAKADLLRASALPIEFATRRAIQNHLQELGVPKLPRDKVPSTFSVFLSYADSRDKSTVDELANRFRTTGHYVRTELDQSSDRRLSVTYYSKSAEAKAVAEQMKSHVAQLLAEKGYMPAELILTFYFGDTYPYVPSENIEVYLPSLQKAPADLR